jgi:hypothetical protein
MQMRTAGFQGRMQLKINKKGKSCPAASIQIAPGTLPAQAQGGVALSVAQVILQMLPEGYWNGSQASCTLASYPDHIGVVGEIHGNGIGIEALSQKGEIGRLYHLQDGYIRRKKG